jgi:hypothetical protein
LSITNNSTGAAAKVGLYDLAYISNSGGATGFATAASQGMRGTGNGYYTTLSFATISPAANSDGIGYKIAATSDVFSGSDCATITGTGGAPSGKLEGAFGQQIIVGLPIKNQTGSARSFRIYIGTLANPGYSFAFASIGGQSIYYTDYNANSNKYRDVIDTGSIANGSTLTVNFTTAVTSVSSTPYVVGARAI